MIQRVTRKIGSNNFGISFKPCLTIVFYKNCDTLDINAFVTDQSINFVSISLILVGNNFEFSVLQKSNVSLPEFVQIDIKVTSDDQMTAARPAFHFAKKIQKSS